MTSTSIKIGLTKLLVLDNFPLKKLPVEENTENYCRQVPNACFSPVQPTPLKNPQLVSIAAPVFEEILDVDSSKLPLLSKSPILQFNDDPEAHKELAELFAGNKLFDGSTPAAHCYCGHQFGNFAGQLGDGAAIYLGSIKNKKGELWDIQLKGAGKTPYSRGSDGRKVLRSSIREFLCSEAMHHLGIPTTRAASLVTSDSYVVRDMFYDGHPREERCSVVSRVSPTFLRFGSFEICKPMDAMTGRHGPSCHGDRGIIRQMLRFLVQHYYPEIYSKHAKEHKEASATNDDQSGGAQSSSFQQEEEEMFAEFYEEIVCRTARLVALWQCVGFCHGVLNTDNMSAVGVTIDYGPFGFVDAFDWDFVCNASDSSGRYSYRAQPAICKWNCGKLAEALDGVLPLRVSRAILDRTFDVEYRAAYLQMMRDKLGILESEQDKEEQDRKLIGELFDTMQETGADFTNTFLMLTRMLELDSGINTTTDNTNRIAAADTTNNNVSEAQLIKRIVSSRDQRLKMFQPAISEEERKFYWMIAGNDRDRLTQMGFGFVLEAEQREQWHKKIQEMSNEEKLAADTQLWTDWLAKYRARLHTQFSEEGKAEERKTDSQTAQTVRRIQAINRMRSANPHLVLRNFVAEEAIREAEKGNYRAVQELLAKLQKPFLEPIKMPIDAADEAAERAEAAPPNCSSSNAIDNALKTPPNWAYQLKVS